MELRLRLQPGELTEDLLRRVLALAQGQAVELTLRTTDTVVMPTDVVHQPSYDRQQLDELDAELAGL